MASSLIDSMAGDFDPDEFTDDYRAALQQVIDAKVGGKEIVAPPEVEEAPTGAIDLMAALRASVERAKAAREAGAAAEPRSTSRSTPTPITSAKSAQGSGEEGRAEPTAKAAPAKKATEAAPAKKATGRRRRRPPAAKKAAKRRPKTAPANGRARRPDRAKPAASKAPGQGPQVGLNAAPVVIARRPATWSVMPGRPLRPSVATVERRRRRTGPRSTFLSNLPTEVFGTASMKAHRSGSCQRAIDAAEELAQLVGAWPVAPSRSTTVASGRSPQRSSGTPTTQASSTAGWAISAFSSSTELIHSPPDLMTSLARSVSVR